MRQVQCGRRGDGQLIGTAPMQAALAGFRKHGLLAALILLTTGCAPHSADIRPSFDIPATFGSDVAPLPSTAGLHWRTFIQDPQLAALIDAALANNRDIAVAAGRVAEARALYRIQQSPLLPNMTGGVGAARVRTPADLSITGSAITSDQFFSRLSAGWELDFWGKYDALRDAAREQFLATREAHDAVATAIVVDLGNRYLLEREYAERIALATQSLATREHSLRIMTRRFEVGSGSKLEVTQAATLLDQARTAHAALIQERDINRNALALLAGMPIRLDEGSLSSPTVAEIPVGLSSDLLQFRPDVRAAELRLKAARANVRAARAAFFPSIALTGAFGTASAELDGLFRTGSESWSFTPAISVPLFDYGRTRGNFDLAEARQNVAVADYERTVQSAFRDVSDALVLRRQLGLQVESLRSMVATARERTRLAQLRYDNGRSAYLEVLDAQRDLFDVEQRLVQVRRAQFATGLGLYAALGGNFAAAIRDERTMPDAIPVKEIKP